MTVKRVAIVWRNAIIAVARRRGLAALDARMLAWLDDLGVDSSELWSNKKATRKTCLRPHGVARRRKLGRPTPSSSRPASRVSASSTGRTEPTRRFAPMTRVGLESVGPR